MIKMAIRAGRVFDGQQVLGPRTVVVSSGRIEAVEQGQVVDALDLGDDVTLLPGLVDAHVHLAFDASPDVLASLDVDDVALLSRMQLAAGQHLAAGVTTVRDLGDRGFLATQVSTPLTVVAAGPPVTIAGGHCWFLGGEVTGVDDLLRAVEERAARGCGVVKVMVSGGNITPGSSPFVSQFGVAELRQVVNEAHRLGLSTAAHAHAPQAVLDALDAGFDTLEHVTFMTEDGVGATPEMLERLADSEAYVSATLGVLPGAAPPPAIAARLQQVTINHVWLATHGARFTVGTDAGVGPGKPHGVLPHALRDLSAHLPAADALRALTSVAADAVGLGTRKGRLAPGADADLLAVRGDPSVDPEALLDVVGVWVGGVRHR